MLEDFFKSFFEKGTKPSVDEFVEKCAYAAAAVTLIPIPGSEIVAVMPIHVGLVVGIGQIYGIEMSKESAMNLILKISATVGFSLVGSRIATTVSKIILPGFGGLISAPLIFGSTIAIGNIAKAYFENNGEIDTKSMKEMYDDIVKKAKKQFNPDALKKDEYQEVAKAAAKTETPVPVQAETPAQRLNKLKELLDQGLISQEEFDETKKKVLESI